MQVGVRLLDMGVVRPVRSQSIYHGIADMMEPGSDPAIVLCRTNRPYVSIQETAAAAGGVDHEYCRNNNLPVIPRQTNGRLELVDNHQIRCHVIAPLTTWEGMGLPAARDERSAFFAQPVTLALAKLGLTARYLAADDIQVNGRTISTLRMGETEHLLVLSVSLPWESDAPLLSEVMALSGDTMQHKVRESVETYTTNLRRELDNLPSVEVIASALVESLEAQWGLSAYPSFPTPEELEVIEEWDGELAEIAWNTAMPPSPDSLTIAQITANVKVMSAALKHDGDRTSAIVRTVDDEIDSVVLTGPVRTDAKSVLENLAGKFAPAGVDGELLLGKLKTIAGADMGATPDAGKITAAHTAAILP